MFISWTGFRIGFFQPLRVLGFAAVSVFAGDDIYSLRCPKCNGNNIILIEGGSNMKKLSFVLSSFMLSGSVDKLPTRLAKDPV